MRRDTLPLLQPAGAQADARGQGESGRYYDSSQAQGHQAGKVPRDQLCQRAGDLDRGGPSQLDVGQHRSQEG